jgi:hypothetical protein
MKRSLRDTMSAPKTQKSNSNRPLRPKWLHISVPKENGEGKEMIFLSKDSLLSSIPAELQLETIQFLGYHDTLNLKATCRYYNYFISEDVLEDSRTRQLERFEEIERRSKFEKLANVPCYNCLKEKPIAQFYHVPGQWYYNTQPCLPLPDPGTRFCIPCAFKTKRIAPGLNLNVNGNVYLICSGCKRFGKNPASAVVTSKNGYNYAQYCDLCKHDFDQLLAFGWILRFLQFVLGLIIFALACTGSSVPISSVVSKSSLRYIFTVTIVSCGISGNHGACI